MVGKDRTFISLLTAANGVGKTAAGSAMLAHILFGNRPGGNDWFNYPIFNNFPYEKMGRVVSDPTTIQEVMIPELKKWFPRGRYTTAKSGKNYEYNWETDTGFKFELMTYEQDPKEFESATLGFAWFDEPPPLAIFKATVARMRMGGLIFITATPLTGSAWMYDHILNYRGENTDQRDYIQADVEANCKDHGIRGILNHKDIMRMVEEYDDEDKQARIYGKFQHLTGMVFKNFEPKVHVISPFNITHRDYCVIEALDPHPRNPDAVLWLAVDRMGTFFVVDELYGTFKTPELARRIHNKADRFRIEGRWADPAAFVEDKHQIDPSRQMLAGQLRELGLDYMKATKDRQRADRRVKDAFDYEVRGKDIVVAPELYIFDTCKRTIWEIEHYQWDDWRGKAAERKSPKEKPMDKDDHMIECLGRLLIQEPVYIPPPNIQGASYGIKEARSFDPYD